MSFFGRRHSKLKGNDVGTIVWKEVASAAERLALILDETIEGRVVKQLDDGSFWVLDDYALPTWTELTAIGVAAVTSVAGRAGDVALTITDVGGLGTAAALDAGESADELVQFDGTGKLPALDGSQLTNLPASGSAVTIEDDGAALTTDVKLINFAGAGISVVESATDEVTVTVAPGAAPVDSVFSRQGAVTAQPSDYAASQIDNDSGVSGAFVDGALDALGAAAAAAQSTADTAEGKADSAQTDATAAKTKTDRITVTQAVNLDTIESDTASNNSKISYTDAAAVAANTAHATGDGSDHTLVQANADALAVLGTASVEDVGIVIGNVVQLENVGGSPGMPAVDGSQLTNLPTGSGSAVSVHDESGTLLTTDVTKFRFGGGGITVTEPVADEVTVTIAPGAAPIATVFGRTGAVLATSGDYDSDLVDNASTVNGGTGTVSGALEQLDSDIGTHTHDTLANVAENRILGRQSADSGPSEELTPAQARSVMELGTAAQSDIGTGVGEVPVHDFVGNIPATTFTARSNATEATEFAEYGIAPYSSRITAFTIGGTPQASPVDIGIYGMSANASVPGTDGGDLYLTGGGTVSGQLGRVLIQGRELNLGSVPLTTGSTVDGYDIGATLGALGGAANLEVGTTAGTVAAGDHTHPISDLDAIPAARIVGSVAGGAPAALTQADARTVLNVASADITATKAELTAHTTSDGSSHSQVATNQSDIATLQGQIAAASIVFVGNTEPASPSFGDIWIETP